MASKKHGKASSFPTVTFEIATYFSIPHGRKVQAAGNPESPDYPLCDLASDYRSFAGNSLETLRI
jgi:hypothetical protein